MDCLQCGKVFFGDNIKFCSMKCYQDYIKDSEEKLNEVVKDELSRKKDHDLET